MAKVAIPPVKLPWREQDIKSGDPELLANYLKVLVKTLQKKIEEIGNVVNVNADKFNSNGGGGGGDMYKADYDPDHDKKVEKADYADRAGYANNSGKLNNHPDTDFMLKTEYDNNNDGKVDSAENADNAQTLQGKEPSDFATSDHSHALDELNNVNISNPNDKQVLIYDGNNNVWINGDVSGGGGNGNVLVDVTDQCRIEWITKPIPCYPYIRYTALSGSFQVGETVKGLTSGATGKVFSTSAYMLRLYLTNVSGTFQNQEQIKGLTSGATAKVYYYTGQRNYPDNITHGSEDSILTEDLNDYLEWESTANGHLVRVAWLKVYVPEQEGLYVVFPVMGTGSMIDDKISYRYVKTFTAISPINCDYGYQNLFASPWRFNSVLGFREGLPGGYFFDTKDVGESHGGYGYFAFYFEQRDTATLRWRIHRIKVYKVLEGGNGGGSSTLAGLSDTDINNPQNNQGLLFSNGKWINSDNIMLKTNYDSDGDGKVDNAENADNAQTLQGKKPSDFADANHTHSVEDLSDTEINSPEDGHILHYLNGKWVNASSAHSHYIGDLVDVNISNPSDGQVLTYDNQNNNWKNTTLDFSCSKQQNGYTKLPNGLIIQWGKITVNVTNTNAHWEGNIQNTFPIQFPNAVFSITMTRDNYNSADIFVTDFRLKNINKYGFYFDFLVQAVATTGTVNWFWMAIGH